MPGDIFRTKHKKSRQKSVNRDSQCKPCPGGEVRAHQQVRGSRSMFASRKMASVQERRKTSSSHFLLKSALQRPALHMTPKDRLSPFPKAAAEPTHHPQRTGQQPGDTASLNGGIARTNIPRLPQTLILLHASFNVFTLIL